MSDFGWDLPPGTKAFRDMVLQFRCFEEGCDLAQARHRWDVPAVSEPGGIFIKDEDDTLCPECGHLAEEVDSVGRMV